MNTALDMIRARATEIAALCQRYGVSRLELFGSATTAGFNPATSDLDFLVEYDDHLATGDVFERFFGLAEALERIFHRRVDLVVARAIRNPYFATKVIAQRQLIHAA